MAAHNFQRNTRQRRVIMEELQKLTSHATADELYEIVRQRLPKISLGTVYRNLELLSQSGLTQKLDSCGSKARFDGNPEPHCHVRCVRCERVDDIHEISAKLMNKEVTCLQGYKILGHRVEFLGLCPECKDQQEME